MKFRAFAVAVEQYRDRYVLLAPSDYKSNFVDIVGTANTKLTLDGKDTSSSSRRSPELNITSRASSLARARTALTCSNPAPPSGSRCSATARTRATSIPVA